MCAFEQIRPSKPALLTTREPEGALFRQRRGKSQCTFGGQRQVICLDAIVEVGGVPPAQLRAKCQRDPVLNVAELVGTVEVTLPSGETIAVASGQELRALPEARIVAATFSDRELALFASQARALGFGPTPTATPRPTPSPRPTVRVTETVGPAPNPPANTVLPSVSWVEYQHVVRADPGTWTGTPPVTFGYSWEVACRKDGSGCTPTGATGDTYQLAGNQDCYFVRVVVTATNAAGSASASSLPFDIDCVD